MGDRIKSESPTGSPRNAHEDAVTAGARRAKACAELEISDRTLRRWTKDGQLRADQRPLVQHPEPANKLSA